MTKVLACLGPEGFGPHRVEMTPEGPALWPVQAPVTGYLAPGFVDIHIHGGNGVDFMTADAAQMSEWDAYLASQGYEAFLPTTVTAPLKEVATAVAHWKEAPRARGFHLEGPFISPKHPGAQPVNSIVGPSEGRTDWEAVLDDPGLTVVTLAPEIEGGLELVRKLATRGVIVSLGHTDATEAQARSAFDQGARQTTHTFNAMRPFHHREPGVIGAALTLDSVVCELIYDGHHVTRTAAGLLFRCKGVDNVVAVSDATMAAGLPDGTALAMWGHDCVVRDGAVRLTSIGALAGSASTLLDGFRRLATDFGPETAIRACCLTPRRVLGLDGAPATWNVFDNEYRLVSSHCLSDKVAWC